MRASFVIVVHTLVFNAPGELLLLRRANTGFMDGHYALPGGHRQSGVVIVFGGLRGEELPSRRFCDRSARDRIGELGGPERTGPYLADEVGLGAKSLRYMSTAGVRDADALTGDFGEADGLREVAVVTDNDADVVPVAPSVVEEMGGEIDIRAFLLGSEDLDGSWAGAGVSERSAGAACHKSAEVREMGGWQVRRARR